MSTAADLIARALRVINVLASGETPTANEQSDALATLNSMLDAWRTESLMVYALRTEQLAMTGAASYTVGTGGDLNTTRPVKIESAYWRNGDVDYPLRLADAKAWAGVADKSTAGTPDWLYYEPAYPLGVVHLTPAPSSGTLHLVTWTPFAALGANDPVALPPGYEEAIVYQLAARLAIEYGRGVPPDVAALARAAKTDIKRANFRVPKMDIGFSGRRYDIQSGQ